LDKLDDTIAVPLLEAIARLTDNPCPHGYKKLKGGTGTEYDPVITALSTIFLIIPLSSTLLPLATGRMYMSKKLR
jgi:hypothetical protein